MEELKDLFYSQLCKLRKQQNLTQEQISELLSISPRCFQKWENGESLPDFIHMLSLVHHLNFDMHAFAEEVFSNDILSAS